MVSPAFKVWLIIEFLRIIEHFDMNAEEIDYVRSKSGWSDVILKNINSIDEAKIYLKAGLKEAMVGGRFWDTCKLPWHNVT